MYADSNWEAIELKLINCERCEPCGGRRLGDEGCD